MANDTESTVIELKADVTGLKAAMFDAQRATEAASKRLEQRLGEFAKSTDKNLGFFRLSWATAVGSFASDALQAGLGKASAAISDFVQRGIEGAAEDEAAFSRLNQALERTGLVSEETKDAMREFAEAQMLVSTASDDQVANAAALIQTMAALDRDGLQKATKAALDLSAALRIDLDSAAQLVAKAANGNVTALSKMGLEIRKGKTDAETFARALAMIEERTGGSAEAATRTYAGAVLQLRVAYDETAEALAKALTQNPALTAVLNQLSVEVRNLGGWIDQNRAGIREWVSKGIVFAADTIPYLVRGIQIWGRALQFVVGLQIKSWSMMKGAFGEQSQAVTDLLAGLERMKKAAEDGAKANGELFGPPSPKAKGKDALIKKTEEGLKRIKSAAEQAGEALAKSLTSENSRHQRRIASVDVDFNSNEETPDEYAKRLEEVRDIEAEHMAQQMLQLASARSANLITEEQYTAAKDALVEQHGLKQIEIDKRVADSQKRFNDQRKQNMMSTLAYISTLQQSSSKELFAIGKAAALATATIQGIQAVQVALASAPPPFNFALAALVGTAAAVNVAKIASQQPPQYNRGVDSVPGAGFRDTVPALLTPRERVIQAPANRDLTDFLARQNAGGGERTIQLTVNVQGNVLDGRQLGIMCIEAINEANRATRAQIFRAAVAS
jgi:hypothetical protein